MVLPRVRLVAEPEAVALLVAAGAAVADRVKVAIKPKAQRSPAETKQKVLHPTRPKVVAPLEGDEPRLPRGSPANPACPAMYRSSR